MLTSQRRLEVFGNGWNTAPPIDLELSNIRSAPLSRLHVFIKPHTAYYETEFQFADTQGMGARRVRWGNRRLSIFDKARATRTFIMERERIEGSYVPTAIYMVQSKGLCDSVVERG